MTCLSAGLWHARDLAGRNGLPLEGVWCQTALWSNLRTCKESNIRAASPDLLDQEPTAHRPLARLKESCYKSAR